MDASVAGGMSLHGIIDFVTLFLCLRVAVTHTTYMCSFDIIF